MNEINLKFQGPWKYQQFGFVVGGGGKGKWIKQMEQEMS